MSTFESGTEAFEHIGIKRRSGRYPWGSGDDPYQRSRDFRAFVDDLKGQGLSEGEIVKHIETFVKANGGHSFKSTDYRAAVSASTEQIYRENQAVAKKLKETGMSTSAIAREMSVTSAKPINESTVRGWLAASEKIKEDSLVAVTSALKNQLEEKPFLDIGKGTQLYMGIADTKLRTAAALLRDEGYPVHTIKLPQLGTDKQTTYLVLTKPDVTWHDARAAVLDGRLRTVAAQSDDNGSTFSVARPTPVNMSSKRVDVRWAEQGGTTMDGVIELRRGVPDLDLGASRYAQVRIAVDGTHYLKGMAMYADDLPAGVDVRFNTNKSASSDKLAAMKPMKKDPTNPFGAQTYQKTYTDKSGNEKTSLLNVVNEEGRWDAWSKSLSSQMLSKQSVTLAHQQLGEARAKRQKELDEINALTNPVVKRKLLEEFADSADSAAVHLKAAALPRQSTHVILPLNSMRPHEIYAPNFNNGEKVVLVRHPHGGPFEIPELTVNNNSRIAKRILGGAKDAVGIHHSVAEQLSGADFDGDTVLVIPNDSGKVKVRPPLKGLANFDPKKQYKIADDDTTTTRMTKQTTQSEMGKISNLITDMTIHRASEDELARAVRHSMVVIDAEKHGLDYKQSAKDNMIPQLKEKYQGGANRGSATIISRASSDARIDQRKQLYGDKGINPKTGEKVYVNTGNGYVKQLKDKNGNPTGKTAEVKNITKGTQMEFATDARDLLSGDPKLPYSERGTPMERTYADYANAMKAMANQARKDYVAIKPPRQSAAAKAVYAKEVKSLDNKLKEALMNAPLERRAQAIGNAMAKAKIDANPMLDKDEIKKIKYTALEDARLMTGASKKRLGSDASPITPREWDAIQSGAVSATKLREILANADMDRIRELATPRPRTALTVGQMARARQMEAQGRSVTDIAEQLGLPRSTVADNLAAKA